MPIASAVVVPVAKEEEGPLAARLSGIEGVEVSGVGDRGIAIILEGEDLDGLKRLSQAIAGWDEVMDFQLAYFNWEDLDTDSHGQGLRS
jgi:nitrate reductase NapAB chaperone NapD